MSTLTKPGEPKQVRSDRPRRRRLELGGLLHHDQITPSVEPLKTNVDGPEIGRLELGGLLHTLHSEAANCSHSCVSWAGQDPWVDRFSVKCRSKIVVGFGENRISHHCLDVVPIFEPHGYSWLPFANLHHFGLFWEALVQPNQSI
jgi:hypothetical protein